MHGKSLIVAATALLGLAGCASGPSISEIRPQVKSVTYVQNGREPLDMSFGVVDANSFWAAHGSDVGVQTGGWMWHVIGASASSEELQRAPTNAEIMAHLYNHHPMADQAVKAVMPEIAHAWGFTYDPNRLQIIDPPSKPVEDKDGYLLALKPTTDLVLVAWINSLALTEKVTMGAALAAGFTLGMNTKNVTAESYLWMRAYQRQADGRYKRVWTNGCGVMNMNMEVSYPFPELVQSKEKAKTLWDDATPRIIENCKSMLRLQAKQG
jgi:hypothetical protein